MKKIIILGATGSIGTQTLRVVRHLNDDFSIEGLSVNKNIEALEPLIYEFSPQAVAVCCSTQATILRKRIQGKSLTRVLEGMDGIIELASSLSADFVMSAMVGTAGLLPTIEAIKSKKNIGLANKEVLVTAGKIVMDLVKEHQVQLIPVDSEHSAIFQCLKGQDIHAVSKIILTASGGPFRGFSTQQLEKVQIQDALSHPNWTMGAKVSIDSSTLMNKGLELIEAKWLFDVDTSQLQVVVHPQSIIHSLVEYKDSSIIAQLGEPSMLTPIQYALTYPKRAKGLLKPFNFFKHSTL